MLGKINPGWCAPLLFLLSACALPPYPAPPGRAIQPNRPPAAPPPDPGDVPAVQRVENGCRARMRSQTAEASLVALDRVHEVVGSSCDVETVGRDPLHWLLRCRTDALFESGRYELDPAAEQNCAELQNQRVSPWVCAGAVFEQLFEQQKGGAIERMGIAVVGHVDMQPINPSSNSHLCIELQKAFEYAPSPEWTAVPAAPTEEDRQRANRQLAWCRAASVAQKIRQGIERARRGAGRTDFELAALGLGTSWLRSRPGGICPSHGQSWSVRKECADARRVDLLVSFVPRLESTQSTCDKKGDDPATALYCMQQCTEQAAAGGRSGAGATIESAPLFVNGAERSEELPDGWYLKRLPSTPNRRLDLKRVCGTIGVDQP